MAIQIYELRDGEGECRGAVMTCTVTGLAFGPILGRDHDMDAPEYGEAFLRWWAYSGHEDPRSACVAFIQAQLKLFDRFVSCALERKIPLVELYELDDDDWAKLYRSAHPETWDEAEEDEDEAEVERDREMAGGYSADH